MFQQVGCLWELFCTPFFDITKMVDGSRSSVIDTIVYNEMLYNLVFLY